MSDNWHDGHEPGGLFDRDRWEDSYSPEVSREDGRNVTVWTNEDLQKGAAAFRWGHCFAMLMKLGKSLEEAKAEATRREPLGAPK